MGMAFSGFTISNRGMDTAKSAIDVMNNNIANSNVEGYSKQIARIRASKPEPTASGNGMFGTGAEVYQIERENDSYLSYKFWNESATKGEYEVKETQINQIEELFKEPSESGFIQKYNDFFSALQKTSSNPSDKSVRENLKQQAISLTRFFNSASSKLHEYQKEINNNIKSKVNQINSLGDQIKNINLQILKMEVSGSKANNLRDEREKLVNDLSSIINTKVSYRNNNGVEQCVVKINNQILVDNGITNKLEYKVRSTKKNPEDASNLYEIDWKNGLNFDMYDNKLEGELKGYIDLRDGNNDDAVYKGIPHYIKKIDKFAQTFARAFNEGEYPDGSNIEGMEYAHVDGYGANGSTGNLLFTHETTNGEAVDTASFADYSDITAENFSVSKDVLDNINNLAMSSAESEESNNDIASNLIKLKSNDSIFQEGKFTDYMGSVISEIAIDSNQAQKINDGQEVIIKNIKNQQLSVSGVDINEEVMNMVKFQKAYTASAKMMQTLNEIYDITINGLGL